LKVYKAGVAGRVLKEKKKERKYEEKLKTGRWRGRGRYSSIIHEDMKFLSVSDFTCTAIYSLLHNYESELLTLASRSLHFISRLSSTPN
jgi:hypothetical protein